MTSSDDGVHVIGTKSSSSSKSRQPQMKTRQVGRWRWNACVSSSQSLTDAAKLSSLSTRSVCGLARARRPRVFALVCTENGIAPKCKGKPWFLGNEMLPRGCAAGDSVNVEWLAGSSADEAVTVGAWRSLCGLHTVWRGCRVRRHDAAVCVCIHASEHTNTHGTWRD